jgi:hypothetical protein
MDREDADWRKYERRIFEKLYEWGGRDAKVRFDQSLPGRYSKTDRQVDALVTGGYGGRIAEGVTAAVDCKFYRQKVDVNGVEQFIGLVDDVGTDLGFLITTQGFSEAADKRAENGSRGIRLRVVVVDINNPPYFPASDEDYYVGDYFDHSPYGPMGAVVRYHYVEESEYTLDPEAEFDWREEVLISGEGDELRWDDDAARTAIARIVLRHRMKEEPDEEFVQMFAEEIAADWEDGQTWTVYSGEIASAIGV